MRRMWINQPSKLQPNHRYHGVNVLADLAATGGPRVWFVAGPTVSMSISRPALSDGWVGDLAERSIETTAVRTAVIGRRAA